MIVSLLFVMCPIPADATIIIPSTLQSMSDYVDTIIVGQIKHSYSYWEGKKIYTDVVVEVEDFVKNATEETATEITLKLLGGTVGEMTLTVDMSPEFTLGEKVMLFLLKREEGYLLFDFSYGVFRISNDDSRQQEVVTGAYFTYPEHFDLQTKEPLSISEDLLVGESELQIGVTLDFFLQRVKQCVQ
jgi:hypothetical protein